MREFQVVLAKIDASLERMERRLGEVVAINEAQTKTAPSSSRAIDRAVGQGENPLQARELEVPTVTSAVTSSVQAAPTPPAPDPETVARDLVARNVPLTLDENFRIDRKALVEAQVDARIVDALRSNLFLAGQVGRQVEQALSQLENYAKLNPLNLIRKHNQMSLGGDAPASLIELARFHGRNPLMQERLRRLHDELNAPVMERSAPVAEAAKGRSPLPNTAERVSSDEPQLPPNADILHGEAARKAALHAAWQRGR